MGVVIDIKCSCVNIIIDINLLILIKQALIKNYYLLINKFIDINLHKF